MTTDTTTPRPVLRMDPLAREFLAQCHAEANHRSVKAGHPSMPCIHCGRDYPWHVLEGVYWVEWLWWYSRPRRGASIMSWTKVLYRSRSSFQARMRAMTRSTIALVGNVRNASKSFTIE